MDVEEQMATVALERYDSFMRHSTGQDILTDAQIYNHHEKALEAITSQIHLRPFFPSDESWSDYYHTVCRRAAERHKFYIQSNSEKINEQRRRRERLMTDTIQMFDEVLSRYRGTVRTTATVNNLRAFLPTARSFAWGIYKLKAKELHLPHVQWKAFFLSQLDKVQANHIQSHNNGSGPGTGTMRHEDFVRKFKKIHNSVSVSAFTLVLHLDATTVSGAVYKKNNADSSISLASSKSWPFVLVFEGDTTRIPLLSAGAEALKKGGIHLHDELLRNPTRDATVFSVVIRSAATTLKLEELLSMYFYKVKRDLETELNVALDSVTLVISPYLSTREKQVLKTSLTLAGFQESALLHSSTAAIRGMTSPAPPRGGREGTPRQNDIDGYVLAIQETGSHFQVCLAHVTTSHVEVRALTRFTKSQNGFFDRLKDAVLKVRQESKLPHHHQNSGVTPLVVTNRDSKSILKFLETNFYFVNGHLGREGSCEDSVPWGAALLTKIPWNSTVVEISKATLVAAENMNSFNLIRYITEKLTSKQKVHKLISANEPQVTRSVLVSLGTNTTLTLCNVLEDGVTSLPIASVAIRKEAYQRILKIEFIISAEGLIEIFPLDSHTRELAPDAVKIEFNYMSMNEIMESKDKLWAHYFKAKAAKNYFDPCWAKFCGNTIRFGEGPGGTKGSGSGDFGGRSSKHDEEARLENALVELRKYVKKVEGAIYSSQSVTNTRVLEKIRQDLRDCGPFLGDVRPLLDTVQARDVERQLTKLKISTQTLNMY